MLHNEKPCNLYNSPSTVKVIIMRWACKTDKINYIIYIYILWHANSLLGNDSETSSYTTAVAR
jgi:hypothetical protein